MRFIHFVPQAADSAKIISPSLKLNICIISLNFVPKFVVTDRKYIYEPIFDFKA